MASAAAQEIHGNFNRLSFTRNFLEWAAQDRSLISITVKTESESETYSINTIRKLQNAGFSLQTMTNLFAITKNNIQVGHASFEQLRVMCWYWNNGDQIVFPVNSENTIYLGNDGLEWIDYWPFLKKINYNSYACALPGYKLTSINKASKSEPHLLIGGQAHFGHFIMNQLVSLRANLDSNKCPSNWFSIIHPPDYTEIQRELLKHYAGLNTTKWHSLPKQNGIFEIENCAVPCIDEHAFGLIHGKGAIELKFNNREIAQGKRIYITRGIEGRNDRLLNFNKFVQDIEDLGFYVCNPSNLDFKEKLNLLGDAEIILSDSGSCWLNGLLFSNLNTKLINMFPSSILSCINQYAIGQLPMNIGLFTDNIMYPLEVSEKTKQSNSNPWYDKCIPPSKDEILSAIKNRF
jgi:hypothetical protein